MCKIPKEASVKCFICLSDDEIEVCKSCDGGMCYRHKAVHKNSDGQCYPFKVVIRGDLGRILVATRNIRRGELIFQERPAVVGPYSRTRPQCLTCFQTFDQSHVYTCPRCGFPMCGDQCARGETHTGAECELLARAGVRVTIGDLETISDQYSGVTVLRLLLLLQRERTALSARSQCDDDPDYLLCLADSLMDHNTVRREEQREVWAWEQQTMVTWLRDTCGLDTWSEQEIHAAHGRILMNATCLDLEGPGRGAGLFPVYSMMNTSCRNNTVSTVMGDHSMEIRAKTRIRAGEEITNQYMAPDTPTYLRRPLMRQKWFFDCSCPRCLDPEELGSCFGALLCQQGAGGAHRVCGGAVVSSDPRDNEAEFRCRECGQRLAWDDVRSQISTAEAMLHTVTSGDGVIEHYERVLWQLSSLLHPGNYLVLEVKQKLALLYGNIFPYTINRMGRPSRERKVQLCHDVLFRLSRLESGISETRIVLMTELAKMTDSSYLGDNPDPGGRKGMMAKLLLSDQALTLTNCLSLCQ